MYGQLNLWRVSQLKISQKVKLKLDFHPKRENLLISPVFKEKKQRGSKKIYRISKPSKLVSTVMILPSKKYLMHKRSGIKGS